MLPVVRMNVLSDSSSHEQRSRPILVFAAPTCPIGGLGLPGVDSADYYGKIRQERGFNVPDGKLTRT